MGGEVSVVGVDEPPEDCPDCGGGLARGGLALSCRDCAWSSDLEDTARWMGFAPERVQ